MDVERELRRELDVLARKRAQLDAPRSRGGNTGDSASSGNRSNVFARLGGGSDSPRGAWRGGAGHNGNGSRARAVLKENAFEDNHRSGKRGIHDRNNDRFAAASKRQRLHSAVAKPGGDRDDNNDRDDSDDGKATERKKRAVAPYSQKDTMARSRRMFGALMGHLGKAKAQIERDSDLFKRQDSKQHEAEEKEKIQSKTLEEKAKRGAAIQKCEKLIARTEVDMAEQLARLKLEHLQSVRKSASLSGFLQTVASPPIYYLPAKHTKETEDLVAASREAHEEKLQISVREHQIRLRELEADFQSKLEKYRAQLEEAKQEATQSIENPGTVDDKEERDGVEENGNESVRKDEVSGDDAMDTGEADDKDTAEQEQERDINGSSDMPDATEARMDDGDVEKSDEASEPENAATREGERAATSPVKPEGSSASSDGTSKVTTGDEVRTDPAVKEPSSEPAEHEDADSESCTSEALTTPVKQTIDISKLKVTELREQLKKRGLDTKGLKANLLERLEEAMGQEAV